MVRTTRWTSSTASSTADVAVNISWHEDVKDVMAHDIRGCAPGGISNQQQRIRRVRDARHHDRYLGLWCHRAPRSGPQLHPPSTTKRSQSMITIYGWGTVRSRV